MALATLSDGSVINAATLNAYPAAINNLSTYKLGGPAPRATPPRVKLRVTTILTIATATNTAVPWDTVDENTDNMFSPSVPTQVTIRTAGTYLARIDWPWTGNTLGSRVVWGCKNGTTIPTNAVCIDEGLGISITEPSSSYQRGTVQKASVLLPGCVVGDTFFVVVYQNAGSGVPVWYHDHPLSSLSLTRIGP